MFMVFGPENGGGSGGNTGDGTGDNTGDQNLNPDGTPKDGDKPKDNKPNPDPKKEVKFSQEDVDKAVKDRLARLKSDQDKENKEKQGEFEKLYNEAKPQLETLTTENDELKKQNEVYSGLLESQIQNTIKEWPKEIKDLYPSSAGIQQRLEWVEKSSGLVKRLTTQKPPVDGQHGNQGSGGGIKSVETASTARYAVPTSIPGVSVAKKG